MSKQEKLLHIRDCERRQTLMHSSRRKSGLQIIRVISSACEERNLKFYILSTDSLLKTRYTREMSVGKYAPKENVNVKVFAFFFLNV